MTQSFLKLNLPATNCGTPLVHIFQNSRNVSSVHSITFYGLLAVREEGEGFQSLFNSKFWKKRNIQINSLSLMGSYAPPSRQATRLPLSVEYKLEELARKYNILPAAEVARQKLAAVGEHAALDILSKISLSRTVRNLTGYIIRMVEKFVVIPMDEGPRWHCNESQTSMSLSMADSDDVPSLNDRSSEDGATQCPSPSSSSSGEEIFPTGCQQMQTSVGDYLADLSKKSQLWKAFGKLDFPKAFLVLNYVTPYQLEDVLRIEDIHDLQGMGMADVESKMRQAIGLKADSTFHLEGKRYSWNPNKEHEYHCYVSCEGKCTFEGPFSIDTTNCLQRELGDSNVLQVHFAEELVSEQQQPNGKNQKGSLRSNAKIKEFQKLAKEGIPVGLRRYQFFVFKDSGKEKKNSCNSSSVKCYFVCTKSFAKADRNSSYILFNKSIHEARCMFMHIHNVSSLNKYMPRLSLILSKTICFNISNVEIEHLKDIPCMDNEKNKAYDINGEPMIHTDGTGFISEDLASQCSFRVYKGKKYGDSKVHPLLFQCRIFYDGFAVKGTLLVNKKLPPKLIQVRESMIKVNRDESLNSCKSIKSLEICKNSSKPATADLSRNLIALLSYGGVQKEFFIDLVKGAFERIRCAFRDREKALKVATMHKNMDDDHVILRMLASGIPLDETFLQYRLQQFMSEEVKKFQKGKVPLDQSFYLMGTADPTGQLKPDEVCVILDHGQVSGKVLVYKDPGMHFGDIHLFKATYVDDIEKIVGDSKFGIFFSTQGPRSPVDEIANSDFDGDLYWVSMNGNLLEQFQPGTPWRRPVREKGMPQPKPADFSYMELEDKLIEEFLNLRFAPSNSIGIAANSWLVYMDGLLTPRGKDPTERQTLKEKILQLTDIYYEALDAPKTGKKVEVPPNLRPKERPHFLKKDSQDKINKHFYHSTSVLGEIYDLALSENRSQSAEIRTKPCFGDAHVAKFTDLWQGHYDLYKSEMRKAMECPDRSRKSSDARRIIQKYKEILYGTSTLAGSKKGREQIHLEACAIYHVVYEHAKKVKTVERCKFAWCVAGEALCDMYIKNQKEEQILCSPSILYNCFS